MKKITLSIDPERLKDENLKQAFTQLFGSQALNKVLDPDYQPDYEFTAEEVDAMTDTEFERNKDLILDALSKGRILQKTDDK